MTKVTLELDVGDLSTVQFALGALALAAQTASAVIRAQVNAQMSAATPPQKMAAVDIEKTPPPP